MKISKLYRKPSREMATIFVSLALLMCFVPDSTQALPSVVSLPSSRSGFGDRVRPSLDDCKNEDFWQIFSHDESLFKTKRIHLRSSAVNATTPSILDVLVGDVISDSNMTSRRDNDVCKHGGHFEEPQPDGDACCKTWVKLIDLEWLPWRHHFWIK